MLKQLLHPVTIGLIHHHGKSISFSYSTLRSNRISRLKSYIFISPIYDVMLLDLDIIRCILSCDFDFRSPRHLESNNHYMISKELVMCDYTIQIAIEHNIDYKCWINRAVHIIVLMWSRCGVFSLKNEPLYDEFTHTKELGIIDQIINIISEYDDYIKNDINDRFIYDKLYESIKTFTPVNLQEIFGK